MVGLFSVCFVAICKPESISSGDYKLEDNWHANIGEWNSKDLTEERGMWEYRL